jgi:hypothetical protein
MKAAAGVRGRVDAIGFGGYERELRGKLQGVTKTSVHTSGTSALLACLLSYGINVYVIDEAYEVR